MHMQLLKCRCLNISHQLVLSHLMDKLLLPIPWKPYGRPNLDMVRHSGSERSRSHGIIQAERRGLSRVYPELEIEPLDQVMAL